MFQSSRFLVSLVALCAASVAAAAPVDLGAAGGYTLVSFGDFNSQNNSIRGNVAVAGNLTAQGYSLNGSSLVVGGDLNYRNASIAGNAYVGGTRSTQGISIGGQWLSGPAPLGFDGLATQMASLSDDLAGLSATGRSQSQWGGLYLSGSNSAIEVFNLSSSDFSGHGWSNLSNLAQGSTILFNIGGSQVNLSQGMLSGLGPYNVLLNFYEAQTLSLSGVQLNASILAPGAKVVGSNGTVAGNVVVGSWNAGLTLTGTGAFRQTDVAAYLPAPAPQTLPPAIEATPPTQSLPSLASDAAEVPEPGQLALITLGLAIAAVVTHRRRRRA